MIPKRYTPCNIGRTINKPILLGKVGEQNALRIEFGCEEWLTDYPNATIELYVKRPDNDGYHPALGEEGYDRIWIIDERAVLTAGNGVIELILKDAETGTKIKSATGYTTVESSPSASGDPSDLGFVTYSRAQNLTEAQKRQARNNIGAGTGTGTGTGGGDGFSPTIEVQAIEGGHRFIITDIDGEKVVDVMDGKDGKAGEPGEDGRGIDSVVRTSGNGSAGSTDVYTITYTDNTTSNLTVYNGKDGVDGEPGANGVSPTVAVQTIDGGHRVTITSAAETQSFDVMNGTDGAPGAPGSPGEKGDAGRGIVSIERTSGDGSAGTVDTYTITYTDGTTSTYQVRNGADGKDGSNAEGGGTSVELDTTLTQSGKAADAKATGDAIAAEKAAREKAVNELNEAIDNKLPSDGTAADSSKLSGKEAGEYTLKSDLWKRVHNTTGAIRNMLSIAASYFPHKDEFVYGNWNTAVNTNCTQVDGKWEIDCSSFVSLVLMGVPYEGSRYNGHTQNVGHPGYVFDVFEPTSAGRPYGWLASKLAQYAEENGYFYTLDGNIDSVMPGDIIFVNNSVEGTYLDIGHCAIALSVDKKEDYITCLEVAEDTFAIKGWPIADGKAAYAARFPLIDCDCPSEEDFVKTDSITFPMAVQKTISANAVSIGVDYIPLTKEFSEYDILTMVIRMDTPLPDGCQFTLGATISGTFKAFNKIGDAYAENLYAFTFMLPEGFTQDVVNKNPVIQLRISAGTGNAETVIDATIASINVYEGYVRPAWMEGNVVGSGSEYTLPVATETALGGVKAPAATDDMTQQVHVKEDGTMWVPEGGGGESGYELIMDVTLTEEVKVISATFDKPTPYTDLYIMISLVGTANVANDTKWWSFQLRPKYANKGIWMNIRQSKNPETIQYYIAKVKVTDGMVYYTGYSPNTTGFTDFNSQNGISVSNKARPISEMTSDGTRELDGFCFYCWNDASEPAGIGSTFKVWGVRG